MSGRESAGQSRTWCCRRDGEVVRSSCGADCVPTSVPERGGDRPDARYAQISSCKMR
jgi:hypothetical protein